MRESERKMHNAQERNCLSPIVCILFISVTNSTQRHYGTVVKRYNVDTIVCRSFQDLFLPRTVLMSWWK